MDKSLSEQLLLAFQKIQSIADTGLLYCKDEYGRERYHDLKETATTAMAALTGNSLETIQNFYSQVTDYPTPKVDVRAFIVNEANEILMVKERADGKWTLPGGWADVGNTASESVIKEVKEETGLTAHVVRLLAVFDKKMHPHPPQPFYVYKMAFLCQVTGDWTFEKAFDVLDVAFFSIDKLPELSEDRILASQIQLLYHNYINNITEAIAD
ncbi:ADP-ribose pyrophosphatase YjhB, NUDIX family [Filimonas lacunae]|uniref:ADP-ribose pyrophosphatase YjhB, NUDIX family n=1 Tax=Filimonas lacunae TaxID=477680 RepID=A0A173MIA8_9BACT|nr:NUDIX hydrolase N-terminal domain-containing protein [Filimonas lacunae]BAV07148.1 MutT/nudix family protein [Filimonas lacunae]SIS94295.1 ADP-ribose pyrophosphatase YjhB, NUDIX family [Filimonas lacunae]